MLRTLPLLIMHTMLAIVSLGVALSVGSIDISLADLWRVLINQGTTEHSSIIWQLRWPRAGAAFATGGLLSIAGVLMQVLLRNPLADPYVLGTSGGAALFALLAMLVGFSGIVLAGSAFAGALFSTLLVMGIAHGRDSWTANRLLLTGVVIAFGWGAFISFILSVAPQYNLRGMLFWLMGDLSHSTLAWPGLLALVILLIITLPMSRTLNILQGGSQQAAALGVNLQRSQWILYLLASLCTAIAVTLAGTVGFVGLVVPHLLRLICGRSDHLLIIPGSVLLGGSLLVFADTLARTAFAPLQIPVGVMTAAIGVPVFLYLLYRHART